MQRISIYFRLNARKGDTPETVRPIDCRIRYAVNGERLELKFASGQTCEIQHWEPASQRVKSRVSFARQTNDRLHEIADNAERIYRDCIERGTMPTPADFRDMVLRGVYQVEEERDMMKDFAAYIESQQNKKTHRSNLSTLANLARHLQAFAKRERWPLHYRGINEDFGGRFTAYLEGQPTGRAKGETYNTNTVGGYIKKLRLFLNWAKKNGYNKFEFYTAIKIPSARVQNHYLEPAEKTALLFLDLRHRPGLAAVRDWFLLACEVGMRFGDYEQARNPDNLREVKKDGQTVGYELHFSPAKTAKSSGVQVVAPLSRTAIQIFQRHGWQMPPTISEQVFNRSLKELAQMASIKKDISSHDARRTFATLAYRSGMPTRAIMAVTGHRTETEFRKYLCLTPDEYAEQWRQHSTEYQHHTPGLLDNPLGLAA